MTPCLVPAFPYAANGLGALKAAAVYKNTRTGIDGAVGRAPGPMREQGE